MLVYIDHYDSFSDILIDYFKQLAQQVRVLRTDEVTLDKIDEADPDYLVIGPGPGHPQDLSLNEVYHILKRRHTKFPMLGICLGHQIICRFFGAKIQQLDTIHHGVVSPLLDTSGIIFDGLNDRIEVTRYHSLSVSEHQFPKCLSVIASSIDNSQKVIMGFEHIHYPIYGLQFHPEAIKTTQGLKMLENFLKAKKKQPN